MVYGPDLNEVPLEHRNDRAPAVDSSSRFYGWTGHDRNGSHQDRVGQVSRISPDASFNTPTVHVRGATLPSATGPNKDIGPSSHSPTLPSVKSVVRPTDTRETSKVLPSSVAGFGQVIETTRVQPKRPVPVFSPETTMRTRRAIHPLEEPCAPLTPLALTPKLGQPQACSSPFEGAVLFGT